MSNYMVRLNINYSPMEKKRKKVVCGYYLIKIYNDTDTRGPGEVCSYVAKN